MARSAPRACSGWPNTALKTRSWGFGIIRDATVGARCDEGKLDGRPPARSGRFRQRRHRAGDDASAALNGDAPAHRASPRPQCCHRGCGEAARQVRSKFRRLRQPRRNETTGPAEAVPISPPHTQATLRREASALNRGNPEFELRPFGSRKAGRVRNYVVNSSPARRELADSSCGAYPPCGLSPTVRFSRIALGVMDGFR
jgi:hypothetical protein